MTSKLTMGVAALAAAASIAACGSSSPTHTSSTRSGTGTTAGAAANPRVRVHPAAPVHGRTVSRKLAGTPGRKLTVADVKHLRAPRHPGQHAHISGLDNLSLTQKLNVFLGAVGSFWQDVFKQNGGQLPSASAVAIADQPFTCGSAQWTSASAPAYCPPNTTMMFPLGSITSNVAPLGDAAVLLMTSDLFSYHVENALGVFSKGYTGVQLKEIDSCLSGFFFGNGLSLLPNGVKFGPGDQESVNAYLAQEAGAVGTGTGGGGITAQDLTAWFNKGAVSTDPSICVKAS